MEQQRIEQERVEHEQQKLWLEEQQLEQEQQKLGLEEQQHQRQLRTAEAGAVAAGRAAASAAAAARENRPCASAGALSLDRQEQSAPEQLDNLHPQSSSADASVPLKQLPTDAIDGLVYATLKCRDDQQPWEYQMRKTRIVLGRKLKGEQVCDCEVGVGKYISREHAVIACDTTRTPHTLTLQCVCTGKAWVTPLGKRSDAVEPTQHDAPYELQDDDEIRIGRAAGEVSMIIGDSRRRRCC